MATSTHANSHATTGTTSGGWSTQRIAICALFVAVSMIVSYMEIPVPPVAWLKYDPSGAVCLVAGLAFGTGTGTIVSVLSWLPHLFMNPWGGLMGILCTLALVVPASLVYERITPIYTPTMTSADVMAMIVPVLLPFNIIKVALNCAVTAVVFKPVSRLVSR